MTAAQQGFVFEFLREEHILVSFQGTSPTPEDWDRYLAFLSTLDLESLRFMVYIDGSTPLPAQLQRLGRIVRGHEVTAAVVASSVALRFAVSAFALVTRRIQYFMPAQLPEALAYLRCSVIEGRRVQEAVHRLKGAG